MKDLINKFIQIITATLLFMIVVYGIVYAQQGCCSKIADACIPTVNRVSDSYFIDDCCKISPTRNRNNQLLSAKSSENLLADFGSGNTCCETDRCDGYNQATVFSISPIQDFYPFQTIVRSFDADSGVQSTFHPNKRSIFHNAVPIYILTESIICWFTVLEINRFCISLFPRFAGNCISLPAFIFRISPVFTTNIQ